jgi:hypothetical protein
MVADGKLGGLKGYAFGVEFKGSGHLSGFVPQPDLRWAEFKRYTVK